MKYYIYSRKNEGLFDKEQLRNLSVEKDELVKAENADSWVEAYKVADLSDLFEETVTDDFEDGFSEEVGCDAGVENEDLQQEAKTDTSEKNDLPVPAPSTQLQPIPLKRNWLIGFAAVLGAMILLSSNPKKSEHYEVVQQMIGEGLQTQGGSKSWGESLMDMIFGGFGFFDNMAVERLMNDVECHNAYIFSYSKLNDEEEGSHIVTLGVLGHVFSLNQEAMNDHINNVLYGHRKHKQEQQKESPRRRKPQQTPENGQSL